MKKPAEVREELSRKFRRYRRLWLKERAECLGLISVGAEGDSILDSVKPAFPMSLSLGVPSDKTAAEAGWSGLTEWISDWEAEAKPGEGAIQWRARRFSSMGEQNVPERIDFACADEVARRLGELTDWKKDCHRFDRLMTAFPALRENSEFALDFVKGAADWTDEDVERFISVYEWLAEHPSTNLYLRQLPIPGIHTKWMDEKRKKLFLALHRAVNGTEPDTSTTFESVFGIRVKENRLRFRVLDPAMRALTANLEDLDLPRSQAATLPLAPVCVVFSENEQTGLAFPDMPGVVLVLGLGNNVGDLSEIPWLKNARILYWGDLDTYGFDILDNVRAVLPQTESVLMDEATVERWKCYAVTISEKEQYRGKLTHLTPDETRVYEGLQTDRWGENLRLEQERIPWEAALAEVKARLGL